MGVVEMDISYYENEAKRYTDEIAKLEQELVTLHNSGNADSFTYSVMPKDEFLREEANINNHIETARAKIEENNRVINAYNNIINNINALRSLNDSNPDYNHPEVKEELERRSREIEEAKKILPSEIVDSINNGFIMGNQNNASVVNNQSQENVENNKIGIDYFENEVNRYNNEINNLETRLSELQEAKTSIPLEEFLREEANINNHIENAKAKLEENNRVVNAYKNVIENITALRSLNDSNPNYNHPEVKEELERRSKEIKQSKELLPPEIIDSINENFINDMNKKVETAKEDKKEEETSLDNDKKDIPEVEAQKTDTIEPNNEDKGFVLVDPPKNNTPVNNFDSRWRPTYTTNTNTNGQDNQNKDNVSDTPVNNEEKGLSVVHPKDLVENVPLTPIPPVKEEKPIKVAGRKAWNWVKKNKKKIIIALGITAITVAVVMLFAQLMPAITALSQAQQLSAITGTMVNNAASWHGASAAGKAALHLANEGLAKSVMSLTGKTALFNSSTGIWTFAGTELANLAATATTAVTAQVAKVAAISKTAAILGASGLGVSGLGMLASRRKGNKKSEPVASVDNTIEQTNTDSNEEARTVEQTNVNTENREEVKASEQVNTNTENKKFGDIADSLVEQEENKSVYNKCNDAINELISLYPKSNEDGKAFLLDRLNILYNDIDTSLKLGMEERELLKEKINSFTDSLEENKGRGK